MNNEEKRKRREFNLYTQQQEEFSNHNIPLRRASSGSFNGKIEEVSISVTKEEFSVVSIIIVQDDVLEVLNVGIPENLFLIPGFNHINDLWKGCDIKWTAKRERIVVNDEIQKYPKLVSIQIKHEGVWFTPFQIQ